MLKFSRRRTLGHLIAAGAWVFGTKAVADTPTPSATEGPFYPTKSMRLEDIDNDLVKVAGLVQEAGGTIITLGGQVLDQNDQPLAGLRVEIWQCDVNGIYMHTRAPDHDMFDTGFQGFGHDITGPDGRYTFRTIMPTVYPGRTPHIHVKVFAQDKELLTTQFYLADHPGNDRDRIYGRLSDAEKAQVTMQFAQGADGPETTVNIVV